MSKKKSKKKKQKQSQKAKVTEQAVNEMPSEAAEVADSAEQETASTATSQDDAESFGKDDAKEKTSASVDDESGQEAVDEKKSRDRAIFGGIFGVSAILLLLLMAYSGRLPHGSLIGLLLTIGTSVGLLGLWGFLPRVVGTNAFEATPLSAFDGEPAFFAPKIAAPISLGLLLLIGLGGGYPYLPHAIIASLLVLAPASLRRPGLGVFVITALIYLPLVGTFGLWDPWETHYGEVAREMVSRNDWISLWWAHENWFWSKPILIFWSEAFWFSALDVDVLPGMNPAHPEWAIRLPVVTFSLCAVVVTYHALKRIFGIRPAVVGALALASAPHFFMLSHQAITDMYLVANVTMAVCFLALAITSGDREKVILRWPTKNAEDTDKAELAYRERELLGSPSTLFGRAVGLPQMVLGLLCLLVIPQAFYLIGRNIVLYLGDQGNGFAFEGDTFLFGSGNNDGWDPVTNEGTAGLVRHQIQLPAIDAFWAQPISQGILWLAILAIVLLMLRNTRERRSFYMVAFYIFCALAFMGKTIPGVAIPGMIALFFLIGSKRWNLLLSGSLKVMPGILIVLMVSMPWFVAMFMRHAAGFTDRLLVHDNINRVAAGVHGDTGSIQYFIEQLGFGLFPWVALVPAGVLAWLWLRRNDGTIPVYEGAALHLPEAERGVRQQEALLLFGLWFFAAFTLFSAMITKFHHYIFPAVPPAAILSGLMLERAFGQTAQGADRKFSLLASVLSVVASALLVLGVAMLYGNVGGIMDPAEVEVASRGTWAVENAPAFGTSVFVILLGMVAFAGGAWLFWTKRAGMGEVGELAAPDDDESDTAGEAGRPAAASPESTFANLRFATASLAGVGLLAFVARDLSWSTGERPQGLERIIHLFVYNYSRPWPTQFDFRPMLTGFAVVATILFALLAIRWVRAAAARGALVVALLFATWCLNWYMPALAPHWGMENLFETYYTERAGPEEPVLAYQMNWKGENFYSNGAVHIFVDNDDLFRQWIEQNRGKTVYVVLSAGRIGRLQQFFRGSQVERVTTDDFNNKFTLVRIRDI